MREQLTKVVTPSRRTRGAVANAVEAGVGMALKSGYIAKTVSVLAPRFRALQDDAASRQGQAREYSALAS